MRSLGCAVSVALISSIAAADTDSGRMPASEVGLSCTEVLDRLGVEYEPARRRNIAQGVAIGGDLGGVTFRSYGGKPLVIDCSLAVSLALSAPFFAVHGITTVTYSSAYDRRRIRGTRRLSRHSFGLAIDIHTFAGDELEAVTVRDDYEQGLGDNIDCVGQPLTEGGRILRQVTCQLARSELYRIVLDPDYDADHYNHFHLEALPWDERVDQDVMVERLARRSRR